MIEISLTESLRRRFWNKVDKTAGCWIWTGSTNGWGGMINRGPAAKGGNFLAHRVSWVIHNGPIPKGMMVLHNCPGGDNPRCVNPDHLWLGTQRDNVIDLMAKGRRPDDYAKGEKNGRHKLTAENVAEIRKILQPGTRAKYGLVTDLAKQFGVSVSAIQCVRDGRKWSHVT